MTQDQHDAIVSDLCTLAREGASLIKGGAIIRTTAGTRAYLSGIPYLWSGFVERAFCFASVQQATEFLARHPSLRGCLIVEQES